LRGAYRHGASTARSSPEVGRFVFYLVVQEWIVAKCDVCGNETSRVKSPTYAPDEMQRVVAHGFLPDDAALNRWQTEQNLSREAVVSSWKRRVDQFPADWLLCPDCAARAAPYRRSGAAQKRRPRWLPWLIGAAALIVVVLIVNALIPKAQARSLGGFDLDRAAMTALAFSPDGSLLAAGDAEHRIKLFDVKEAKTLQTLRDHGAAITSVAFSPVGSRLASAGKENVIRLWDVKTGQLLKTLDGHTLAVSAVAFSPDGSLLASGGYDKLIQLWDVETGQIVKTLNGHAESVTGVAFSPDGQRLASASQDKTAKVWDVLAGKELFALNGHTGGLASIAYSPDGQWLATGSVDRTVKVWDAATGSIERTLDGFQNSLAGIAFAPDSQRLAAVTDGREAQIRQLKTWEVLRKFEPREGYTYSAVAFSPDGAILALANSLDVSLWDVGRNP
jgi:uncharacterized protein with WD repeat